MAAKENPPTEELAPSSPIMGSARCTMWCMMGVPWFVLNMIRSGIPLLVTFIARRYALPDAQKAVLLGADWRRARFAGGLAA